MESLIKEITEDLKVELGFTEDSDINILSSKVKNSANEIKRDRNYPDTYSEEKIISDLRNYYSNIHDLALYDYNQIGAEGETSHSENSISRTWKNRSECKNGVVAFCKIL